MKEQKVTQIGALIREKASFQHMEQPLFATIVKMAQNDCGTNKSTCSSSRASSGRGNSAGRTRRATVPFHPALDDHARCFRRTTTRS